MKAERRILQNTENCSKFRVHVLDSFTEGKSSRLRRLIQLFCCHSKLTTSGSEDSLFLFRSGVQSAILAPPVICFLKKEYLDLGLVHPVALVYNEK
jgi:hypothetical protein